MNEMGQEGDPPDKKGGTRDTAGKERETIVYQENHVYDRYRVLVQCKRSPDNPTNFISNQKCGMLINEIVTNKSDVVEIRRLNRSKILVVCTSSFTANEIVMNERMRNIYNPFVPFNYVNRVGILRDVDEDFDDNLLLESIDARQFRVKSVQRLNRKVVSPTREVSYVKSRSVKNSFAVLESSENTRNDDFPALGSKNQVNAVEPIEKFVPPPLPYVSSNNVTKKFSKEMNDMNKFTKRRGYSNDVKVSNDAKKLKPSQSTSAVADQRVQYKNNFHPDTRNETARGAHNQEKSDLNVNNASNAHSSYAFQVESSYNQFDNLGYEMGDNDPMIDNNNSTMLVENNTSDNAINNMYRFGGVLSPNLG
ncbi:hypothetical protein M8J76_009408 [Diaphorina citri]|nr:hypothetical protein M8J76_009408 [Diaphorina citri]